MVLVDGHSVAYRSFFAFIRNPLRNSKGRNTSAVFGFANTLRKVLAELKPDSCAVVFDAPGRTFRHEKFERYKVQRPPVPGELLDQLPTIKELVRAWGLVALEVPGVEADDVIGALARRTAAEGGEVVIVTSDKDMLQLIGERIVVYDPWKDIRYGPEQVKEKLGVGPEQVADLLALTGDASDNVPGVPGVGLKRGLEILKKYGTLSAALEQDERVKANADIARLSRELVEIRTDIELPENIRDLRPGAVDKEKLTVLFEELEFRSLLAEVRPQPAFQVELAGDADLDALKVVEVFGLARDSAGDAWISTDGRRAFRVESQLIERLAGLPATKAGYGIKEQLKSLWPRGMTLELPIFDVGIAAWLIDPNRKRYGIEQLAERFLDVRPERLDSPTQAVLAFRLHDALKPQLLTMGLERVSNEIEMPLISVLARIEERGIGVDTEVLHRLEADLTAEQARLE
ncbi:MAG: 5'-3' exonuclease H3TH domain-containing protein, partial [candidate division WOR-3 bacterium]